ncbi:MAG: Hsp20/alpha crystallin family protein [Clostridia bacterium]
MFTLVPYRRTVSPFPSLVSDHFMREFFDVEDAPVMRVDIRQQDDAYLLEAEMPGVQKNDIDLKLEDGMLTISADVNSSKTEKKDGYVFSERQSGHMQRSFNMEGIDVSGIKADYQNGVLLVELPKEKAPEKAKALKIEIGDRQQKISDGE